MMEAHEVKLQTMQLWRDVFGDVEAFVNLYFKDKYTPERNLYAEDDGQVVSALQVLPYRVTFCGAQVSMGYLSGIATRESHRGRGLAGMLIRRAHRQIYDQGGLAALLIPAGLSLFDYYRRAGYGNCGDRYRMTVDLSHLSEAAGSTVSRVETWTPALQALLERHELAAGNALLHTAADMRTVVTDVQLAGGVMGMVTSADGKSAKGLVLAVSSGEGEAYVLRLIAEDAAVEDDLLGFVGHAFHAHRAVIDGVAPDQATTKRPYAQMRVVNVSAMLSLWAAAHPDEDWACSIVADTTIPENVGTYHVADGRCTRTAVDPAVAPVSLDVLAERLVADRGISLSMMLD